MTTAPPHDALPKSASFPAPLSISESSEMNPSKRNTMEDVHRCVSNFDGDPSSTFLAVYDGHGGRGIADFVETRLEKNIALEIRGGAGSVFSSLPAATVSPATQPGSLPPKSHILQAIERAYLITDMQSRQAGIMASGATAVTVLITRRPNAPSSSSYSSTSSFPSQNPLPATIYAANCGDARAVLSRSFGAVAHRLTHDHKASDSLEVSRIESSGGFVLRGRVLGILAVARSLGDHGLKEYVVARPFLSETVVAEDGSDEFVIVACDGLWDVMEDKEAVDAVQMWTKGFEGKIKEREARVARMLIDEALKRGSSDNITVVVAWL